MLSIRKYNPKLLLLLSLLAVMSFSHLEAAGKNQSSNYVERVYLHLCNNTFSAGETIWYRAYCFANNDPKAPFLSKALYVEMIDNKNKQVLHQTVRIIGGTAASSLQIPDTLASGLYYIRAYTQWMRNGGSDCFFKSPVYIYNEYDNDNENGKSMSITPEVFIDGGELVNGIPAKIYLDRIFHDNAKKFFVFNISANRKVAQFTPKENGRLEADFTPSETGNYEVIVGDTLNPEIKIPLPHPEIMGARLNIVKYDNQGVVLKIITNPASIGDYVLSAWNGSINIGKTQIDKENINQEITMHLKEVRNKLIDFVLQMGNDRILAKETVLFSENQLNTPQKVNVYKTRSKVTIEGNSLPFTILPDSKFSVSIHKAGASLTQDGDLMDYEVVACSEGPHILTGSGKGWSEVVPEEVNSDNKMSKNSSYLVKNSKPDHIFPIEEKGIILTGNIINPATSDPLTNVDVLLAMKDTVPDIQSSHTDSLGRFVFLLGKSPVADAVLRIYKNGKNLPGKYTIHFDSKYESIEKPREYTVRYSFDSSYTKMITDDAQREKIQRAFASPNKPLPVVTPKYDWKFYGIPEMTIYPSVYIMLPNFEEISREILPKVKYRRNKHGCTIAVYSEKEGRFLTTPLVLVDGIPITNPCKIYPLNSDDINRIEIQSTRRVAGNMMYEGLVALFTTPARRAKLDEKVRKEMIQVPYYYQSPSFESWRKQTLNDSTSKKPEFFNQLYWNPAFDGGKNSTGTFQFYTSDEEGEYVIDIQGINANGTAVHYQRKFKVQD